MTKRLGKQLADLQYNLPCAKAVGRGWLLTTAACSTPGPTVVMLGILVKK